MGPAGLEGCAELWGLALGCRLIGVGVRRSGVRCF